MRFRELNRTVYGVPKKDFTLTDKKLDMLSDLLRLCGTELVRTPEAKKWHKDGVVTIKNGYVEERYPFLELVLFRLPPVLFSNNYKFLKQWRTVATADYNHIEQLHGSVRNYYVKFKKMAAPF